MIKYQYNFSYLENKRFSDKEDLVSTGLVGATAIGTGVHLLRKNNKSKKKK